MTYDTILDLSAALLNDSAKDVYTNAVQLPYLNIARMELEEIFELNNIPVTNATSAIIEIPQGQTRIGFDRTAVGYGILPGDLVEIQQLFESYSGQNNFIPMTRKETLTPYQPGSDLEVAYFRIWMWQEQEIVVPVAVNDIDLKINYIRKLFSYLAEGDLDDENNIINTSTFFSQHVAGLCARFIDHDDTRADALDGQAAASLQRSLGISIKGKQPIMTRRRPFRANYKTRRNIY